VKSDVYELALVLFVMLVGRLPWDPDDPQGRLSPKHPIELGARLPAPLSAALLRALSVDVDQRPGSALELLETIERAAADPGDGVETRSSPPRELAPNTPVVVTPVVVTPGADAHARTEVHQPTPQTFEVRTAPSPGAPQTPHTPHTPLVEIVAPGGSRPPPRGAMVASASPTGAIETARKSSNVGLLVAGGAIALVGAIGGALATGAIRLGGSPSSEARERATGQRASESAAASPGPRDVFSSQPDASASAPPAAPSASASTSATASAVPTTSARPSSSSAPKASASARPAPPPSASGGASGPLPAVCQQYVALMCSATSGARPEECAAAKSNVARWQTMPPSVATETCQASLSASQKGLPLRQGWHP
jgi:serine/threonine protein kinase